MGRVVLGKRSQPTTVSDGTTTVNVTRVEYDYIDAGGFYIVKAILSLQSTASFSGNVTVTMPDGTTYVEDDYTYQATGNYQPYYGSSAQPPGGVNGPMIRLNDYGQTQFNSTPIVIGSPTLSRGTFVSGINTGSGAGTNASPYASANVVATNAQGQLEATSFDGGAHIGGGLQSYSWHQGTLSITGGSGTTDVATTITHEWGTNSGAATAARPAYALRWSHSTDITSGVATRCFPPMEVYSDGEIYEEEEGEEELIAEWNDGFHIYGEHIDKDNIKVELEAYDIDGGRATTIYWALIIFFEEDYTGGKSI